MRHLGYLQWVIAGTLAAAGTLAYQVPVSDKDDTRQTCSGMYGGSSSHINVTFDAESRGEVAMVIYEWQDVIYLGKQTSTDEYLPKTYICTSDAMIGGSCSYADLGSFIVDLPSGKSLNDTSIWSKRVIFGSAQPSTNVDFTPSKIAAKRVSRAKSGSGDTPVGSWKRTPTPIAQENEDDAGDEMFHTLAGATSTSASSSSPNNTLDYAEPVIYPVQKTGYYCVAIIPLTVNDQTKKRLSERALTDVPTHPTYAGTILFRNVFNGQLPAAEYPKVNFYLALTIAYVVFAGAWGYLCVRHMSDLLPIQYYVSMLAGFLVLEMLANWGYYRYVNAHGTGVSTTAFLVVVTILDAGRNALSFFLLLVVSLGLSVVRESLGPVMLRARILAGLHFTFGVLYAIGLVYLDIESTSAIVLLSFVMPLAFTLSGFLLWIMHALGATIRELQQRKQRYKLSMFKYLQRILIGALAVIVAFFVLSSMSFSDRLSEDFAPNSWQWRWWLIDGYLAILYFAVFVSSAYLWRPTGSNRRLAMSDEIAQDEEDAEDYDMDALESRGQPHPLNADGIPQALAGRRSLGDEDVVFEIGEERDSDDEEVHKPTPRSGRPQRRDDLEGGREEREGLISS